MHARALSIARVAAAILTCAVTMAAAQAAPITFSASGANPAGIQGQVDAYRADLGTLNANVAGSFGSGRREINWDGVPDALAAPNILPADFFNVNSPRGVVFSTAGSGFQVSANAVNPSSAPVRFGNINPTYPNEFQTFSPQRLFTALGSNVLDVNFFVPGSTTAALTNGFGSVFTDVDLANTTSLTFFDGANASLGTFFVPAGTTADASLSFLGVDFGSAVVSRVRITNGNGALGPTEGGGLDLVVMDDFLYGEPVAATANMPEPGTLALLATGMLGLGLVGSRRRSASS
jgi:hypothetical protein